MKKITFLLFVFAYLSFSWQVEAQFTESFDTEIPAGWTVLNEDGGTYTWEYSTVYPHAGAGHARIHWESSAHQDYLITPQFTVTSGVSDRISFYAGIDGTFWTETFEVRLSTTGTNASDFTVVLGSETATTSAAAGDYTRYIYDLSSYDTQSVYIAIVATDTDRYYLAVDEFVNDTMPTDTLDYYNLQWPPNGNITYGDAYTVYAQAYEAGLTDATSGQAPGIVCWIGYSSSDTDPSGSEWTWILATFNNEVGNNDEYMLDLGAEVNTLGTLYYASRWSLNDGPFTYGGIQADGSYGGQWGTDNNISGILMVDPVLPNDICSGALILTPGLIYDDNPVDGTVAGATNDFETNGCGLNGPGVWYTLIVPNDGNITIETGPDSNATTGFDSVLEAFSGTCGSLVSIDCDDDGAATGNYSLLELSGLTPGEAIYLRVWEYNGDETEPFSISAYSGTLSTGNIANESLFSYYPNPVNNILTLKAKKTIESVSVINILGQEVLQVTPNSVNNELDMSNLSNGSYFVKVTVEGLTETVRVIKQ